MRYIQTVNGKITPDELGITLPHEHLIIDYTKIFNFKIPLFHIIVKFNFW